MSIGAMIAAHAAAQRAAHDDQSPAADLPAAPSCSTQQQHLPRHLLAQPRSSSTSSLPVILEGSAIEEEDSEDEDSLECETLEGSNSSQLPHSHAARVLHTSPESSICTPVSPSPSRLSFPASSSCASSALQSALQAIPETCKASTSRPRRANERMAVLLPRSQWKPDSQALKCDMFSCNVQFGLFERRHHCRKCGGVTCAQCSTHRELLLDTSSMPFIIPPADKVDELLADPSTPFVLSRVCDDCHAHIHAKRSPTTSFSSPRRSRALEVQASQSSISSSLSTPPEGQAPIKKEEKKASRPRLARRSTAPSPSRSPLSTPPPAGPLDSYPLRVKSEECKRLGGGVWCPRPLPVDYTRPRLPGQRAQFEIELEEEEEALRWKPNPLIKDGDFQLRKPNDDPPFVPYRGLSVATF